LLKVMVAVTAWTALVAGLGLTVAGPWLIEKWTSGKVEVTHTIMFLFALTVACQSGWSACGSVLFSTNMHHAFNYVCLLLTVLGLWNSLGDGDRGRKPACRRLAPLPKKTGLRSARFAALRADAIVLSPKVGKLL
jgi:hypothetical protein